MDSLRSLIFSLNLASVRSRIIRPGGVGSSGAEAIPTLIARVLSPRPVKLESLETASSRPWPRVVSFTVRAELSGSLRMCFSLSFLRLII